MRKRKNGRERRTLGCGDNDTDSGTDLESSARHEPLATNGTTPRHSQVRIRIDTYRTRLADADGISAKAIIDGLVHCGILRDDSTKEIKEPVEIYQHKVKNEDEERTEVRIRKA